MLVTKDLVPIIGPVIAAMIAGGVAFIASVFTKESKTSEFRQSWIDSLRNDIAEFIGVFNWLTDTARDISKEGKDVSVFDEFKDEFVKMEHMHARIELRLNPVEHGALIKCLRGLSRYRSFDLEDIDSRDRAVDGLIGLSHDVLRREWKRVKRGERIYQATKWASLAILFAAVACAVLVATRLVEVRWVLGA